MRFREKTQSSFVTFIAQGSMENVHMDQRSNPVMNNEGRNWGEFLSDTKGQIWKAQIHNSSGKEMNF
jgi:hypothetical protein